MLKNLLLGLILLITGFCGAKLFEENNSMEVGVLAISAKLQQENHVLTSMEEKGCEFASKMQLEYIKLSIASLEATGFDLPSDIKNIIEKRKPVIAH